MKTPQQWLLNLTGTPHTSGLTVEMVAAIQADARAEAESERDKALAELETLKQPALATHQPCGCQLCVCPGEDRCGGCGAHSCRTEQCVMTKRPDLRVYDDAPTYAQLQAERDKALQDLAAIKAQFGDYTAVTDTKVIQLIIDRDKALAAAGEMRQMLIRAAWLLRDSRNNDQIDLNNEAAKIEQKIYPLINCGQGWLPPEKVQLLVEALEDSNSLLDYLSADATDMRKVQQAENAKALAAVKQP